MTRTWMRGDPVPWFRAPMAGREGEVSLDGFGGRATLMLFLGNREWPTSAGALRLIEEHRHLLDGVRAHLVGVTIDPEDAARPPRATAHHGEHWFHDRDGRIARQYDAIEGEGAESRYRPFWLLLDIRLRVIGRAPIGEGARIFEALDAYLTEGEGEAICPAPVLIVERILAPELCRRLTDLGEERGGTAGFPYPVEDDGLRRAIGSQMQRKLFPMVERVFRFRPAGIENFAIVCQDGTNGGHFAARRENGTPATAHRAFACAISLNAEDYAGGGLRFPEFGGQSYCAPTGAAIVFSRSLIHETLPVLDGRRYALLPFLFDEAGARQLEAYRAQSGMPDGMAQAPQAAG